jgi:hypothetical protein
MRILIKKIVFMKVNGFKALTLGKVWVSCIFQMKMVPAFLKVGGKTTNFMEKLEKYR